MSSMAKTLMCTAAIWSILWFQAGAGFAQEITVPTSNVAPPLRIGSGDLVEVSVYDNPDLSGRFRVDEKGDIAVPLLGLVRVEGETAAEVGATVEKRYVDADILKQSSAHVIVFIAEYASQGITVTGQVKTAGMYPAFGVRMLNDVINAAGGILPTASSRVVITRKSDPGNPIAIEYNPEALTPVIPQIQVFPGDTIMVPRAGIVYVLGKVIRPGGFVLDGRQTLSVERAMALAGGSGPYAAMSRAHLVRTLGDGRKEDIILNVDKIQAAKAPDVAMKDGDILFVPTSNGKLIALQAITSALNIGTNIAIYRTASLP